MPTLDPSHPILKHLTPEQANTLKIVNNMYSKDLKGPQPATGKILHCWGQFSLEIPKNFQPNKGGHCYLKFKSKEEADEACQELRKYIFKKWPDTFEWASEGWYRWMIPDMRQMTLEFSSKK